MKDREFFAEIPKGTKILVRHPENPYTLLVEEVTKTTVRAKVTNGEKVFFREQATAVRQLMGLPQVPQMVNGKPVGLTTTSMVTWSDGDKFALLSDVKETEAPKRAAPKDTGPTIRQRLQPGSKWKLTSDIQLEVPVQVQKSNEHGYKWMDTEWQPGPTVATGTEFEVIGKSRTYRHGDWDCGIVFDLKIDGKLARGVKLAWFKDCVEQVSEQEAVPVFVLRDKATGLFYENYEYVNYYDRQNGGAPIVYTDKWSKYRKWNRLSDVRSALLGFSGYYDGLPGAENSPDWMGGPKTFNVPQTWEIVKFDKLTKKELEVIEAMDTFNHAWRLRELTVKYGSGVRAAYKDLEKKDKLDEFTAMLVFAVPDAEKDNRRWDGEGLTAEEQAEIKDAVSNFDKADVKLGKGKFDTAIAVKDLSTATMLKLAYSGDLECHLIDLKAMQEVVQ